MLNGVFNLASSYLDLKEFGRLHQVLQSNKQCNAHWEGHMCQDTHHEKALFNVFTSKEPLHWGLFVRHIDVRGWELYLRNPLSGGIQTEYCLVVVAFFKSAKLESSTL